MQKLTSNDALMLKRTRKFTVEEMRAQMTLHNAICAYHAIVLHDAYLHRALTRAFMHVMRA